MNKFNVWSLSSFIISFVVIIPILTVSVSFFEETSNYYQILSIVAKWKLSNSGARTE